MKSILVKFLQFGIFSILMTAFSSANISGSIFRDFDLNGIQDTQEAGVLDLTINVYDDAGGKNEKVI